MLRKIVTKIGLDDIAAVVIIVLSFAVAVAWFQTEEHRRRLDQIQTDQRITDQAIAALRVKAARDSEWGQDSMVPDASTPEPDSAPKASACTWPRCKLDAASHAHFNGALWWPIGTSGLYTTYLEH